MKTLLVVRSKQGYLVSSFAEHLRIDGFEVYECDGKIDAVNVYLDESSGLVIYVDEFMAQNKELIIFLKDTVIQKNLPLFLVEGDKDVGSISRQFPDGTVTYSFSRPIDIKSCAEVIFQYFEKYGNKVKKKILVVDDSGTMLRNVKKWLGDDYNVSLANSGTMAIKYMSLERPDLVLLDYDMPIINGKQVLEMIRSESDFASIPVMFLTGKSDKESVVEVKQLKPQGYLLKTMGPREIVKAVDDFFAKTDAVNGKLF